MRDWLHRRYGHVAVVTLPRHDHRLNHLALVACETDHVRTGRQRGRVEGNAVRTRVMNSAGDRGNVQAQIVEHFQSNAFRIGKRIPDLS